MTMKKSIKKLVVNGQVLRVLTIDALADVAGGWIRPPISWSCPQPLVPSASCPQTL
jgi:hypothetical protein